MASIGVCACQLSAAQLLKLNLTRTITQPTTIMVLAELASTTVEIKFRVPFPSFGNQHRQRVRQRASATHEKLDGIIQTGSVRLILLNDREDLVDLFAKERRLHAWCRA